MPEDFKPVILPHGNSKKKKPFYPTLPSTLKAIASSTCMGPKQVVSDVSASVGGILSAVDACSLPRNEQQVTDMKRRQKQVVHTCTSGSDELAVVMQKAYLESSGESFIREMKL